MTNTMPSDRFVSLCADQAAPRLDQYLAKEFPTLSRSQLQKLIHQQKVLIDNQPVKPNTAVKPGDYITLRFPPVTTARPTPEKIPLEILFEDEELVVVNKPAGLVVHPAEGHASGTLVNALLARYPDLLALSELNPDAADRPGIVHRLDQDTSGLIVVARTAAALHSLQQQFKARTVEKTYLALVHSRPDSPEGLIDVPLGRDPRHRQKIAPRLDGKPARTHYRLVEAFAGYSLLEIGLETGRTHQIRVHLAWLGCPVVGDTVYGRRKQNLDLKRQFLHAWRLQFTHPQTGETVRFEAALDETLQAVLDGLR